MKNIQISIILFFFCSLTAVSQERLTQEDVSKHTQYFTISEDHQFSENILEVLNREASNSQFIGIAEVHQSEQLSYFTTALLGLLKKHQFNHLALEIGDYSASILEKASKIPSATSENLKQLNTKYGKSRFPYVPFIFVDKVADAKFIEEASKLQMNLWGIDREYEFSYLLHFDKMFAMSSKSSSIKKKYSKARKLMHKVAFKDKVFGTSKYCWLLKEPIINDYFQEVSNDAGLKAYVSEIRNSWDIYCRFVQNKGGSAARAKYMRKKFDSLYNIALQHENLPKVLVKLGGVHLTHGNSIYGRYDVGRHLHEKAKENNTNFLAIRHVWRYKNGKDQKEKSGWKNTRFLMEMGRKDQWTLIDLRPIKEMVRLQNLQVDQGTAWELKNYDLFLISPNDSKGKINR